MTDQTTDEPVVGKLRGLRNGRRPPRERKALSTDEVVAALRRFRARGVRDADAAPDPTAAEETN